MYRPVQSSILEDWPYLFQKWSRNRCYYWPSICKPGSNQRPASRGRCGCRPTLNLLEIPLRILLRSRERKSDVIVIISPFYHFIYIFDDFNFLLRKGVPPTCYVKNFSLCLFPTFKTWNYNMFSKNLEEICWNIPFIGEWRVMPGHV